MQTRSTLTHSLLVSRILDTIAIWKNNTKLFHKHADMAMAGLCHDIVRMFELNKSKFSHKLVSTIHSKINELISSPIVSRQSKSELVKIRSTFDHEIKRLFNR